MDLDTDAFSENWRVSGAQLAEHEQMFCRFLEQHADDFHFRDAESFLTIGPGEGTLDAYIIKSCMPKLRRFIAIEPVPSLLQATKRNTAFLKNVKKDFHNERVQNYAGPDEQVSVILASHSFYYLHDQLQAEIKRIFDWLSPGGAFIIAIIYEEENNLFYDLRKSVPWTSIVISRCHVMEALQNNNIQYTELLADTCIDASSEDGRFALFDLILNRKATEKEREAMQQVFDKRLKPGCSVLHDKQSVFVARKPVADA